MSELRRDPITGRWNIFNTLEPTGPDGFEREVRQSSQALCPFCAGNERLTPGEIFAVRPPGSQRDGPGWDLRVIPNKFPALRVEGDLNPRGVGLFDLSNGVGAHEVIIETPEHTKQLADCSAEHVTRVLQACRQRVLDLRGDQRLKYSLIFKNFGLTAGASLEHSHSQLIALPVVPRRVLEELTGAQRYLEFRGRCGFCDMLDQELQEQERVVADNASFVAYCPFVSSFPFEVAIVPRVHRWDFAAATPDELADLGRLLREMLRRIRQTLHDPSYNFMILTGPVEAEEPEAYHWRLELVPRLTRVAGFEWGTGFYINPTPPELAAAALRSAALS